MALALTSISPIVVPGNGGHVLVVTGTFDLEIAYHVHLGADASAPICHAGPGKANEVFSLDGTTILCYAPEIGSGVVSDVYVEESATPATNDTLAKILTIIDRDYSTSLWSMKALFPPNRPMGPRAMERLPAPSEPKNLLLYTEDFTQSEWFTNAVSLVHSSDDPFGTNLGVIIHENLANDTHSLHQLVTLEAFTWHVASVYVKAVNRPFVALQVVAAGAAGYIFDLDSETLGAKIGSPGPGTIQSVDHLGESGWFRISVGFRTAGAGGYTFGILVSEDAVSGLLFTGLDQNSILVAFPSLDKWSTARKYRKTEAQALT